MKTLLISLAKHLAFYAMTINTVNKKRFELINTEQTVIGSIEYQNSDFSEGLILLADTFHIQLIAIGVWVTIFNTGSTEKIMTNIKVEAGGTMSIRKFYKRKKYSFRKSVNWKWRFSLFNVEGDELLSLIPTVNWKKESHDFNLQLNEDFEKECDAFLILQALHCANCSLSMMQGGSVPALISV
jgi:hypothetical protein